MKNAEKIINVLVPVAINSAVFYFLPSVFPAVFVHQLMTSVISTMIDKDNWLQYAPQAYLLISQTYLKQYAPGALLPPALSIESLVETYGKTAYPAAALSCLVANRGPTLLVNGAKKGLHWMLKSDENAILQGETTAAAPRRSERLAGKPRPAYR